MKKSIDETLRKEKYDAADNNDKLIINLRDINHTMHFLYEGRGSQSRILIILLEKENITQQELTEHLGIKPGSASEVIAKLEKSGLIKRTKSILDRRTANISLTEAGRALAEDAKRQREIRREEMFSALSENEKSALLSLLEKINSDWEKRYSAENEHHHHGGHHNKHHHEEGKHGGHHHDGQKGCDGNCRECPHPCGRKNRQ